MTKFLDLMFSLNVKTNSKPYQVPPKYVTCTLQKPLMEELEWLEYQVLIITVGLDEKAVLQQFHIGTIAKWKG